MEKEVQELGTNLAILGLIQTTKKLEVVQKGDVVEGKMPEALRISHQHMRSTVEFTEKKAESAKTLMENEVNINLVPQLYRK